MSTSSQDFTKTRYTHRDYTSLKGDLIDLIPSLTQEWTSREESDPGIVLIKLMSTLGDNLSFNMDKMALEMYLNSVTQKKNCSNILNLLGYKMHWYRSATLQATVSTPQNSEAVLAPFSSRVSTSDGTITYTVINPGDTLTPITVPKGSSSPVSLVQGRATEEQFTKDNLVNNRFFLSSNNIDESHIWLFTVDTSTGSRTEVGRLVENLYSELSGTSILFEFGVDEYDQPYIQLAEYWESIFTRSDITFSVEYIISDGVKGSVSSDVLKVFSGISGTISQLVHQSNTGYDIVGNTPGYDPQTVEEARKDAYSYIHTLDTIVTVEDFEKAALRVSDSEVPVVASKVVDSTVAENEDLDKKDSQGKTKVDKVLEETAFFDDTTPTSLKSYNALVQVVLSSFSGGLYKSPDGTTDIEDPDTYNGLYYLYRPNSLNITKLDQFYRSLKIMNVSLIYAATEVYPYKIDGTVFLSEPMDPREIQRIVEEIKVNLVASLSPSQVGYGKTPDLLDITEIVLNSDDKIVRFNPGPKGIVYNTEDEFTLSTIDITRYTGVDQNNFVIDPRIMKFKIYNTGSKPATLQLSDPTVKINFPAGEMTVVTEVKSLEDLTRFCNLLSSNPSLKYKG